MKSVSTQTAGGFNGRPGAGRGPSVIRSGLAGRRWGAALGLCVGLLGATLEMGARPLDTDDTGTVAKGEWELEGGIDFARVAGAEEWALTPVLAHGLTDRLQIDFACDYLADDGVSTDRSVFPAVQFKYRWWESTDGRGSLAALAQFRWMVPVRGARDDAQPHGHLRVLATRAIGRGEVDFNAGYEFSAAAGDGDEAWIASVGYRRPITSALGWVSEVFGLFPVQGDAGALIATGITLEGRHGWTFDALVGTGAGRGSPDLRVVLGFVRAL